MAKFGEGDPRWIVEERPDAKNVNNWHWTEKNANQWSKDTLTNLLVNFEMTEGPITIKITEMKKCEGEATANNRKAKLIFFYEWEIELLWEGHVTDEDHKFEGKLEIPNLSDERTAEEIDINASCKNGIKPHEETILHYLRHEGTKLIREKLAQYISGLKTEYSKDLVLPTKDKAATTVPQTNSKTTINKAGHVSQEPCNNDNAYAKETKEKLAAADQKNLKLTETFKVQPEKLFEVFLDEKLVSAWTNSPCKLDPRPTGEFSLFNGMVTGRFLELKPNELIRMSWRLKSYPPGHYADISLQFTDSGDSTLCKVSGKGIPVKQYEATKSGFQLQYFQNIMRTFGFGARLY